MLIAQMTDIHIGFDPEAKPEELNRIRFRDTLDRLIAQPNLPDMLVLSGDITDKGDAESYHKTAELLKACPFPIHMMMGNHDKREGMLGAFPDTPNEGGFLHSAFLADGLLVVLLDTYGEGRHGGEFCDARREWLSAVLEQHRGTPTVIFMHHPPIISGVEWMDPAPSDAWIANFGTAVSGFEDQIQAIHCGHLHRQIVSRFQGIPLSVTPSVAPLVSMDLRKINSDSPDGRALITTESPTFALHLWDGSNLVSHYERVGNWDVLASYSPALQPMIKHMEDERGTG